MSRRITVSPTSEKTRASSFAGIKFAPSGIEEKRKKIDAEEGKWIGMRVIPASSEKSTAVLRNSCRKLTQAAMYSSMMRLDDDEDDQRK